MESNRRALYNSLRMNWIIDPTLELEAWQAQDYRAMPLDEIFERLEDLDIRLDKTSFTAFADTVDSPEELTETLLDEGFSSSEMDRHDQVYLLAFELWRRLLPEKPTLSVLCDAIDHQIHLYDQGQAAIGEGIEDALANLQVVLDENTDEGADPHEAFDAINSGCANDIESFLYDFISEQIDEGNGSYATELLEGFGGYLHDRKWLEFLKARLVAIADPEEANRMVKKLIGGRISDFEFNLEILSFLVSVGDRETFERLAKQSTEFLQVEEDFQALLSISADFYHRLDCEEIEKSLQMILQERDKYRPEKKFDVQDPHFAAFLRTLSSP